VIGVNNGFAIIRSTSPYRRSGSIHETSITIKTISKTRNRD